MTVLWYFHFYFATIRSLRIVRGTLYLYFGADKARPKRVLSSRQYFNGQQYQEVLRTCTFSKYFWTKVLKKQSTKYICPKSRPSLLFIVIVNGHADSERASAHYHLCSPPADRGARQGRRSHWSKNRPRTDVLVLGTNPRGC